MAAGFAVLAATTGGAQTAGFDLPGPVLHARVTRGSASLPLSRVPALVAGDRIRLDMAAPADRASRYTIVLAFLRGATSPPPRDWLFEARPWDPKRAVIDAAVPEGAQQAAVLLVPDTGGAIRAVEAALTGKPGAFVRAVQELNQASLDRARLDAYLAGVRRADPARATDTAATLARTLAVKIDPACLARQPEAQAACLAQNGGAAVLADAQTSSLAQTIAGAPADLALQVSATPQAGFGYYSPYIGLVRDLARIFGAFQSAQLQFIPAIEVRQGDETRLILNTAPSFRRPQSVLVAPLPAIAAAPAPTLSPANDGALCATRAPLLLPVGGAPLVFATDYLHDVTLRVGHDPAGAVDLPAAADPARGGFVVDAAGHPDALRTASEASLHARWGFDPVEGPRFALVAPRADAWHVADRGTLVAGRDASPLALDGGAAACVEAVTLERDGVRQPVGWSATDQHTLALKVPLAEAQPGDVALLVASAGLAEPQRLALKTYAEPSRLGSFVFHAGDRSGVLVGARLEEVATLDLDGATFLPDALGRVRATDRLTMTTVSPDPQRLHPGDARTARVTLVDGRTVALRLVVAPPRPQATLLARSVTRAGAATRFAIEVGDDVVPQDARLTFSFRAQEGTRLAARDQVEVQAGDEEPVRLPIRLQDARVAVAELVPEAVLGRSAAGPLRFRVVQGDATGDWQPLATIARLPTIGGVVCRPAAPRCDLTGSNLFLLRGIAGDGGSIDVPDGFVGSSIATPRPAGGRLLLRLRDAPGARASIRVVG